MQPDSGAPAGPSRKLLLDRALDTHKLVARVEIREITVPARTRIGAHRHPCPVFGQIVSGEILFQVEGEPAQTLELLDPNARTRSTKRNRIGPTTSVAPF